MVQLKDYTVKELKDMIRQVNKKVKIAPISGKKKSELISMLNNHEQIDVIEGKNAVKLVVKPLTVTGEKIKKEKKSKVFEKPPEKPPLTSTAEDGTITILKKKVREEKAKKAPKPKSEKKEEPEHEKKEVKLEKLESNWNEKTYKFDETPSEKKERMRLLKLHIADLEKKLEERLLKDPTATIITKKQKERLEELEENYNDEISPVRFEETLSEKHERIKLRVLHNADLARKNKEEMKEQERKKLEKEEAYKNRSKAKIAYDKKKEKLLTALTRPYISDKNRFKFEDQLEELEKKEEARLLKEKQKKK